MSRRFGATVLFAVVLFAGAAQIAACGTAASDPFVGSWWEPSSGRRVDVKAAAGGYEVRVGADLKAYPAAESGGELRVAHPTLGDLVLRTAPDGELELVSGGTASLLERAPQHQ